MHKVISCILFFFLLHTWGNIVFAQTNSTDSVVYEDEEVIDAAEAVDSVVAVEDEATTYKIAELSPKDSLKQITIATGNVSLNDTIHQLKNQDAFWYADGVEVKEKKEQKSDLTWLENLFKFFGSDGFKYFSWTLIICILLYFIYLFLKNHGIKIFASAPKKVAVTTTEFNKDIFEIDFNAEIDTHIQKQNFSLATRLLFLQLLRRLSEMELIDYAPDKTNFDYLMQLSGKPLFKDFSTLVKYYEYIFYGNFTVNAEQFTIIKNQYAAMHEKLIN